MENEKLREIILNFLKKTRNVLRIVVQRKVQKRVQLCAKKICWKSPQLWQRVELFSNERGKLRKIYLKVHLEWN
jgi:hypothetical protein